MMLPFFLSEKFSLPPQELQFEPYLNKNGRICMNLESKKFKFSFITPSVTRLGDLLDLGKFSKHLATINLPKSPTFLGNFVKVSKSLIFLVKSFLGNFYRHLAFFYWSH